jgi:small GTP-binding protein
MSWEDEGRNSAPRIIFIGDSGVGKTSLIHRICTGAFLSGAPTVGTCVHTFPTKTDIGQKKFQLWDTAGQEVYRKIIPIYFKGADAAIVVFSFAEPSSFANLDGWIEELHANTDPETTTLLVGNKTDVEHIVDEGEARRWANERHYPVLFVSAKSVEGIEALKKEIVEGYVKKVTMRRNPQRIEFGTPGRNADPCC